MDIGSSSRFSHKPGDIPQQAPAMFIGYMSSIGLQLTQLQTLNPESDYLKILNCNPQILSPELNFKWKAMLSQVMVPKNWVGSSCVRVEAFRGLGSRFRVSGVGCRVYSLGTLLHENAFRTLQPHGSPQPFG